MPGELNITADWERLEEGSPEERAAFAALGIRHGEVWLTECRDAYVNRTRSAPMLSAYHLAEWIAWNWWRLRWEPRSYSADWAFAHRLPTIGEGYIWPNITIFSDGERTALIAKSTEERPSTPIRYIANFPAVVPSREFESTIDGFIELVRGQLRAEQIEESNLDALWQDIREERGDPNTAKRRKLEALLGYDPDQVDEEIINRLMADARALGERAMNEVAADHGQGGEILTADTLLAQAERRGFDASPRDAIRLAPGTGLPRVGEVPGWRLGAAAARALREQEQLDGHPLSNKSLAELAGVQVAALTGRHSGSQISFALDQAVDRARVVLRSKWEAGRRFELARLLGDRLVAPGAGRLFPATRAYTYRQKMQRSFAAEFLSPFEAVDEMMDGDYSGEKQLDAAHHFQVSELTIRTLLVNHRRIEREELDEEFDVAAA